ncbi:hypothetical protein Tco_1284653, partial [Tanacetum coccineum]
EEQEPRENVELVNKHLASVEIEKMVEESENVIDDSLILRNVDQNIPGTRLEPKSDKESPEVEITNVVIPVNVNEEEEEITNEVYELKAKGEREDCKGELMVTDTTPTPSSSSLNTKLSTINRLLSLFKANFLSRKSFDTLADHLQEVIVESLPTMVDKHIKEQVENQVLEQVKVQVPVYVAKGLLLEMQQNKEETHKMIAKAMFQERGKLHAEIYSQIHQAIDINIPTLVDGLYLRLLVELLPFALRDQDDPHNDAHPEGENSAKWQKTSEKEILASPHLRKTTPLVQSYQRDPEAPALSLINQDLLYLKKGNSGPEKIV